MTEKHTLLDDGTVKEERWIINDPTQDADFVKISPLKNYIGGVEYWFNVHHRYMERHEYVLNGFGQRELRAKERKAKKEAALSASIAASITSLPDQDTMTAADKQTFTAEMEKFFEPKPATLPA
jgi:hypothetical protein